MQNTTSTDTSLLDLDDDEKTDVHTERRLVELKRVATPGLVHTLKELLAAAEEGKLVGCTFLCNNGNTTSVFFAGYRELGAELVAWEDYRFTQLVERNLEKLNG